MPGVTLPVDFVQANFFKKPLKVRPDSSTIVEETKTPTVQIIVKETKWLRLLKEDMPQAVRSILEEITPQLSTQSVPDEMETKTLKTVVEEPEFQHNGQHNGQHNNGQHNGQHNGTSEVKTVVSEEPKFQHNGQHNGTSEVKTVVEEPKFQHNGQHNGTSEVKTVVEEPKFQHNGQHNGTSEGELNIRANGSVAGEPVESEDNETILELLKLQTQAQKKFLEKMRLEAKRAKEIFAIEKEQKATPQALLKKTKSSEGIRADVKDTEITGRATQNTLQEPASEPQPTIQSIPKETKPEPIQTIVENPEARTAQAIVEGPQAALVPIPATQTIIEDAKPQTIQTIVEDPDIQISQPIVEEPGIKAVHWQPILDEEEPQATPRIAFEKIDSRAAQTIIDESELQAADYLLEDFEEIYADWKAYLKTLPEHMTEKSVQSLQSIAAGAKELRKSLTRLVEWERELRQKYESDSYPGISWDTSHGFNSFDDFLDDVNSPFQKATINDVTSLEVFDLFLKQRHDKLEKARKEKEQKWRLFVRLLQMKETYAQRNVLEISLRQLMKRMDIEELIMEERDLKWLQEKSDSDEVGGVLGLLGEFQMLQNPGKNFNNCLITDSDMNPLDTRSYLPEPVPIRPKAKNAAKRSEPLSESGYASDSSISNESTSSKANSFKLRLNPQKFRLNPPKLKPTIANRSKENGDTKSRKLFDHSDSSSEHDFFSLRPASFEKILLDAQL